MMTAVLPFIAAGSSAAADPPEPVSVLVFSDDAVHGWAVAAAAGMGWNVTSANQTTFNTLLAQGGWSAIAVDAPSRIPRTGGVVDWSPLTNAILCDGACVVFSTPDLRAVGPAGSMLLYAFGVSAGSNLTDVRSIRAWDADHAVFHTPNAISLPISAVANLWPLAGTRIQPNAGATAVAGFTASPAFGEAAIVIGASGRTIINAQLLDDITDAATAVGLWQNQLSYVLNAPAATSDCGPRVPLTVWLNSQNQPVVPLPVVLGVTCGDYDADGWVDLFTCYAPTLWRNDSGAGLVFVPGMDQVLNPLRRRYGASFGDYDNDGFPDLATEPRRVGASTQPPDECLRLLRNDGGVFVDVTLGTTLSPPICFLNAETNCWGDVDGDGQLDLFVPVYPPTDGGSVGNVFLHNLGPDHPSGRRFVELSGPAGLDNPPDTRKPEGAQFCDYDFDGDIDLYSNNALYLNLSHPGVPLFAAMTTAAGGIGFRNVVDEGAAFCDYDLDGDFDLIVAYEKSPGVVIWENRGDGMFVFEQSRIESPLSGLTLGLSCDDWDNDGDIDLITRDTPRRNLLIETGVPTLAVQPWELVSGRVQFPMFAWADFDRDGDRDAAVGNSTTSSFVYLNTTYDATTPAAVKRHVRIRPLRDSPDVPAGLETEYGAMARLALRNAADGHERLAFVASSHGYLNQSEYAVSLSLPPDPLPNDPARDVRFDVTVTFPQTESQGLCRVDRHVNPRLGELDLADLADREITVFRSGTVIVNGVSYAPDAGEPTILTTAAGGLQRPSAASPVADVVASPSGDHFVGMELHNAAGGLPIRIRELIIDGVLATAASPDGVAPPANVVAWDVSDRQSPALMAGQTMALPSRPRNRRTFVPCDWLVLPGRTVRIVARVTAYRGTTIAGPLSEGGVVIGGGVSGTMSAAWEAGAIAAAPVDATQLYLTVRYATVDHDCDANGVPDEVELAAEPSLDCNGNLRPDACEGPACDGIVAGDLNCDGLIDGDDVAPFVRRLLAGSYTCAADMDRNGVMDEEDVAVFAAKLVALV